MKPLVLVGASLCAFYRNGGMAWERLSWIVGMRRLGFDVLAVDQLDERQCVNPPGVPRGYDRCLNVDWGVAVAERFGFADDIAVLGAAGQSLAGRPYSEVVELAGEAEMLVNLAGDLRLDAIKQRVRRRVLVDMDPGITQLWLASGRPVPRVSGHNVHFTIGSNVGTARSSLPTCGLRWHHTRQPVLLDAWPPADAPDPGRLTSILRWRGVGPHGALAKLGYDFPDKADALLNLLPLPSRIPESIELVLRIVPPEDGVRERLESNGWRVISPEVVSEPESFASYVQASGGEISVAKGAYVATQTGWFSDRTTRYLASGLPAIVQDTGFTADVPVGEGLLAFSTLAEAVDAAHRVAGDYEAHRRAARQIAEDYFASDAVIGRLVETVKGNT